MSAPAPSPPLDTAALGAYLAAHLPAVGPILEIAPISGGQSNPTFFLTCGEARLVLRKQPHGPILPSAHAVDREYRVMEALGSAGVAVPRMVHFCADRAVLGTPFYLMERLDGRVLHDGLLSQAPRAERRAMYASLAQTLASLHNVEPKAAGLADYGQPGDYFARQIARWSRQWDLSADQENADITVLKTWLSAHIPPGGEESVVHGDYRMGNVMFHHSEPRVIAILDWELSTLGHPLADVAHSVMGWHSAPQEYGGLLGLDLESHGLPDEAEYLDAYYAHARHGARLTDFHRAFALFRFAVIFAGIAARARQGNAADADAASYAPLAAAFARRARALI